MKITSIGAQQRDRNRVNVSVDGKYRFSLDILQVAELGIRVGKEYSESELTELENESRFGKLYTRALEYALVRPRSHREMKDYLFRKTRDVRTKTGTIRPGATLEMTERVYDRLVTKGHIDDEKFARFWVENRQMRKGISARKLRAELAAKGVARDVIDLVLQESDRNDEDELRKLILKKRQRYDDDQKFIAYLARQGFGYDDIKTALRHEQD